MNPHHPKGLARALRRAHRILALLKSRGMLSQEDYQQALASDLGLSLKPRRSPEALHAFLALSARVAASPQTVHRATIDLDLQQQAARILSQQVAALASSGASQGAALVVDSQTGEILAYVGSRDFFDLQDRGAVDYVQARRSPGSALKAFIYGLGMGQGKLTAATELPDTPMDFQMDSGRVYVPENFSHSFLGPMLAREALANSRNIPALRVLSTVGIPPVLELLELGGVKGISHEPGAYGLGLAIGNLGVTLEELVGLYGMLANGGLTLPLRRFADEPVPLPVRLLPAESAQLIAHILADPLARRPGFPAGGPLDYDYAVAVKTGTSQGFRDAWTVAFSDRLSIGVWIGNHDARRMDHLTGAGATATAVHEMFEAIMPSRSPSRSVSSSFALPQRFLPRDVCPLSGKLAGPECTSRKVEFFAPGTEPIERCPFHHRVQIDVRNQLRAGRSCPPEFVAARTMLDLPEEYQRWARQLHLEVAPLRLSPLCAEGEDEPVAVRIREPHNRARYLWDPGTPPESSTLRFAAEVSPAEEEVVWLVDGTPVAKVAYPHEYLWPLAPGLHTVVAALAHRGRASEPITLTVAR
jgi:penicillin-binding protein 1C